MDVVALFRRIQYLENFIEINFHSKDRIWIQLLRPDSQAEIIRKRRILNFYQKFADKDNLISLEEAYKNLHKGEAINDGTLTKDLKAMDVD